MKLVYFEPLDLTEDEIVKEGEVLTTIRHYLIGNTGNHIDLKHIFFEYIN